MRFISRLGLGLLLFVASILLYARGCMNGMNEAVQPTYAFPSIKDSREVGAFITTVEVHPREFVAGPKRIVIDEAWIERETSLSHLLLFWPEYRLLPGKRLVLGLSTRYMDGADTFQLRFPNAGSSFARQGTGEQVVYQSEIGDPLAPQYVIEVRTSDQGFDESASLHMTVTVPATLIRSSQEPSQHPRP